MDGVAPVDAQNTSTSRLENPHGTRVSHTAHAHHVVGRKKTINDNDRSRTRLAMCPGIRSSLTGRLREDLSEGLRNYLRANISRAARERGVSRSEFIRQHLALVLEQYRRHPKPRSAGTVRALAERGNERELFGARR